jgi:hypothetical protein
VVKNVTITLDEETARWARIRAAECNTSVSRLVGEMLRREMEQADRYEAAMNSFLSRKLAPLREDPSVPYPTREELHDRAGLRRHKPADL